MQEANKGILTIDTDKIIKNPKHILTKQFEYFTTTDGIQSNLCRNSIISYNKIKGDNNQNIPNMLADMKNGLTQLLDNTGHYNTVTVIVTHDDLNSSLVFQVNCDTVNGESIELEERI